MEGVALTLRSVKTRAASIAALACMALLSSSMPVGATLPGDNGFLLSSGAIGAQSGLFAYRADGSGLGILEGTEGAESPAWSPSGRRIASSKVV
jgi:hypothetical protein